MHSLTFLGHGQERARDILLRAWRAGKISHAYLFKGPTGVGKKSMAVAFAALLNCRNRRAHDNCGQCPACKKLASGNHPDFIEIVPDGAGVKIDQIRQALVNSGYGIDDIELALRQVFPPAKKPIPMLPLMLVLLMICIGGSVWG